MSSLSPISFYSLSVSTSLGATGVFRLWNGSAWVAASPDCDAMYILSGAQAIEAQIAATIAASGTLLAACDSEIVTGVSSPSYRDPTTIAQHSIEELMRVGENTANLRLTATVGETRRVSLAALPARGVSDWTLSRTGVLRDVRGNVVAARTCPVGMWVRCPDLVPASADVTRIADPSIYLVEKATYSVQADRWLPQFSSPFTVRLPTSLPDAAGGGSWEHVRSIVLARDHYRCVICGRTADETGAPLEVHHVVPRSVGGWNDPLNLETLCHYHHTLTASYGQEMGEY